MLFVNKLQKEMYESNMRKKLNNRDFSIISQNCVGGVLYHELGMQFLSPTINMWIGTDFVKFVKNIKYYMELVPVLAEDQDQAYPVIAVGDIKLYCQHFKTCDEAIDMWERRKKRIRYDHILVIGNTWDLGENEDLIDELMVCGYPAIIFSDNGMSGKNIIPFPEHKEGISPADTKKNGFRYMDGIFDFVKWINENSVESLK